MSRPARSVPGVFLGASIVAHLLLVAGLSFVSGRSAPVSGPSTLPVELVSPAVLPAAPAPPPRTSQRSERPSRRSAPRRQLRAVQTMVASTDPLSAPLPASDSGDERPAGAVAPPGGAAARVPAAPAPAAAIVRAPEALQIPSPTYPLSARRRGAEGLALVRVRVSPRGEVVEVQLASSSGADDLDRSALQAARSWRFRPGTRGRQPVEAWVNVPVRFQLGREPL